MSTASVMGAGPAAEGLNVIRILTANLCNGRADAAALIALIAHLQVDVVCVQELRPRLATVLSQVLPHGQLGTQRDHRELGIACRYEAEVGQFEHLRHDYHSVHARVRSEALALLDDLPEPERTRELIWFADACQWRDTRLDIVRTLGVVPLTGP